MVLQKYPFFIGADDGDKDHISYHCVWGDDLVEQDDQFLRSIDPAYFDHVALLNGNILETDDGKAKYAATALRIAYSHAMETLFALLGAAIQAPECLSAWVLKYQNARLEALVRNIQTSGPVTTHLVVEPLTWEKLAEIFTQISTDDQEKKDQVIAGFGDLWHRLAVEYLNPHMAEEYNALKHGFRVSQGGFTLAFGLETTPGEAAPAANMRTLVNSQYGTSYFSTEKIHDGRNFRVLNNSHNWNPYKFVYALQLISMSINNILATVRLWRGAAVSDVEFRIPSPLGLFDLPWNQPIPSVTTFNMNSIIDPSDVVPMTKDEIIAACDPIVLPQNPEGTTE